VAGDGTARAAAEMAGPDGPMIAPLPGGTMNMLPHALYGAIPWPEAMANCLKDGQERMISGGEINGRVFFVAAILGSPALWADGAGGGAGRRADLA
jgi:diacylglycerol kinase family enzyme